MIKNFGDKRNTNGFDKNPQNAKKGGTRKGKRVSTILKELMEADVSEVDEKLKGLNINSAIALELLSMIFKDENQTKDKLAAIKEVLDRTEGKPKQEVEQTIKTKNPPIFGGNPLDE